LWPPGKSKLRHEHVWVRAVSVSYRSSLDHHHSQHVGGVTAGAVTRECASAVAASSTRVLVRAASTYRLVCLQRRADRQHHRGEEAMTAALQTLVRWGQDQSG